MDLCFKVVFCRAAYNVIWAIWCELVWFMKTQKKIAFLQGVFFLTLLFIPPTFAADVSTYSARPNQSASVSPPLIMLALSLDHELFREAYSDYSDIDGDGQIDISYSDKFDYYGYFEANWCYNYVNTFGINHFKPIAAATGANEHFCTTPTAPWSGNFLNWATMTRMDLIRKVLYGGKRSYDFASLVLLDRATIPLDFHAFSKIYEGPDVNKLTPYTSSAITICNVSNSIYTGPLIRVKTTVDKDWAALTSVRCQGASVSDYIARIEPCHPSLDSDNCKLYGSVIYGSVKKPVGLIQEYQEQVRLGLITGSYLRNVSGGVLRKNMTFATDEYNVTNGQLINNSGMVATLDNFRVADYNYDENKYECSLSPPVPCGDWGNPISEIYHEALRYISGETSASSDYSVSFGSDLGLPTPPWQDPYSDTNRCANCAIVILSTGQSSFDGDDYNNIGDILSGGLTQLNQLTDNIGSSESGLSFPGSFLVGSNGSASVAQCDPKNLTSLSQARGICPEVPQYEGSYYVAGLASYARLNDLRSDLEGFQNIITYGIEIGQVAPSLKFAVPDGLGGSSVVDFSPICQTHGFILGELVESEYAPCRFLDMDINSYTYNAGGLLENISLRMAWADEAYGGDGDTDASAYYTVTVGINSLVIRINDPKFRGANTFRLGYSLSGVKDYSGMVFDADYLSAYAEAGGTNGHYDDGDSQSALIISIGTGGDDCNTATDCKVATPEDVTKQFTPDNNKANVLPKPLQLAAKYGGFTDLDGDETPEHDADGDGTSDDSREWDNKNNRTGATGADGIADNYFFSDNPLLLKEQLTRIFQDVENRVSSSSSIALVANSSSGIGTAVQALYRPQVEINKSKLTWIGLLNSLFVDTYGNFREDSDKNGVLDDSDFIIKQIFDSSSNETLVQRYTSADGGKTLLAQGSPVSLEDLKPVWAAHEQLMKVADVITQRPYSDTSDTGRHLLTWLDYDADDVVDAGEQEPLTQATFGIIHSGYLGVTAFESEALIKFIRGEDQPGFRSRSVDYDNDGTKEVWRLGDIVNSSPVQVDEPKGFYTGNRSYNPKDTTFTSFREYYKDRRRVVYVGSNGGLIHAFNSGFWDEANKRFLLSNGSQSSHPLGGELWAYAPMNLLPHLQWLSDPVYPHVFYMDGEPLIFDANIFPADADHPGGWGTVMVMGMGLGGGNYTNSSLVHGSVIQQSSAYVVMDITNPEKPPKLLAEVKHPQLGFTTSRPELIKRRLPNSSGDYGSPLSNDWYLVFGSGPNGTGDSGTRNALDNATSEQTLKVFIYDLKNKQFLSRFNPYDTGIPEAYSGDMLVVDWDDNNYDDVVYFGSINTNPLGGALLRINLEEPSPNDWNVSTLLNIGRPITASPLALTNSDNERWLFSGTGRSLVGSDRLDTAQEHYFGVKEPSDSSGFTYAEVNKNNLINTTSIQVRANGDLSPTFLIKPGVYVNNFDDLRTSIKTEPGWINDFERDGTNPSSKNLSSAVSTFSTLFFTEYKPPADHCLIDGDGFLRALHYQTGTAVPAKERRLLTKGIITDTTVSVNKISIGEGIAPSPIIHRTGDGKTKLIVQGQPGDISDIDLDEKPATLPPTPSPLTGERQSWRQIHDIPW